MRVAGDFLERGNLLFGAVFQHPEVFLLESGDVIAGLVGHQRGDQHQFSARGELDFGVVLFLFIFVFIFFCRSVLPRPKSSKLTRRLEWHSRIAHGRLSFPYSRLIARKGCRVAYCTG